MHQFVLNILSKITIDINQGPYFLTSFYLNLILVNMNV